VPPQRTQHLPLAVDHHRRMDAASPKATIEELLAHAEWLRALASKLIREDEAEDALQETWIAALRSAPP
jgi:DNA-directed RNA polymerase specialized sigma24 family protein